MDIVKVALTALASVVALFVITKIMGHKQVAQLDFFDYVCGITIGSIGAELATEPESTEKPLIALASSAPSATKVTVIPLAIPKDRTPNRLFALTLRSSFSTQMELLKLFAFWMKKVAGRACSPMVLVMVTSCEIIGRYSISFAFDYYIC